MWPSKLGPILSLGDCVPGSLIPSGVQRMPFTRWQDSRSKRVWRTHTPKSICHPVGAGPEVLFDSRQSWVTSPLGSIVIFQSCGLPEKLQNNLSPPNVNHSSWVSWLPSAEWLARQVIVKSHDLGACCWRHSSIAPKLAMGQVSY